MKQLTRQEKLDIPYAIKANNHFEHKEVDLTKRTVDLIANTYYYFDSDRDVLIPGCCAKSIADRGPDSSAPGKIKHADHHDLKSIVGKPTLIEETQIDGMFVLHANSFFPETQKSEAVLIDYQNDLIDQHSIGFNYRQLEFIEAGAEEWDQTLATLINPEDAVEKGYLWLVKEIELFEYSNVAFGANRLTPYLGSKSANKNIQYSNMITKLNALHEQLRSGSGDKYIMQLEKKQIEQMIYELYNPEPSGKPTLKEPDESDTFDLSQAIDNLIIN